MSKSKVGKIALSVAAALAASSIAMQAQAHCLTQSITTNSTSAYQQDVYMLNCPTGTKSLVGKASLISGTNINYQIGKGGYTAGSTSDTSATPTAVCTTVGSSEAISAGATGAIYVNGNAGVYTLLASKDTASTSNYAIEFHCMSGTNGSGTEYAGTSPSTGTWQQGGPLGVDTTGLTDALDAVSGSSATANDTNTDANLVINH